MAETRSIYSLHSGRNLLNHITIQDSIKRDPVGLVHWAVDCKLQVQIRPYLHFRRNKFPICNFEIDLCFVRWLSVPFTEQEKIITRTFTVIANYMEENFSLKCISCFIGIPRIFMKSSTLIILLIQMYPVYNFPSYLCKMLWFHNTLFSITCCLLNAYLVYVHKNITKKWHRRILRNLYSKRFDSRV